MRLSKSVLDPLPGSPFTQSWKDEGVESKWLQRAETLKEAWLLPGPSTQVQTTKDPWPKQSVFRGAEAVRSAGLNDYLGDAFFAASSLLQSGLATAPSYLQPGRAALHVTRKYQKGDVVLEEAHLRWRKPPVQAEELFTWVVSTGEKKNFSRLWAAVDARSLLSRVHYVQAEKKAVLGQEGCPPAVLLEVHVQFRRAAS